VRAFGVVLCVGSAVLLYMVYDGYGRLLSLLVRLRRPPPSAAGGQTSALPSISIVLPVFNEERRIRAKLDNLLAQDFPRGRMEVIVVSDGCTDATEPIVEQHAVGAKLVRTAGRVGKSLAQNQGVAASGGDIVVLTDVAVIMDSSCLRRLVAAFADPSIGCTTARLLFGTAGSVTGQDQGTYWRYELQLRRLESRLGLLATAAGPAMAIRRDLWRDLPAEYGDDCVLPLDVLLQRRRVVQVEDAVAWDEAFDTAQSEYAARIRMTVRNWLGTFSRPELLNPLRHPGVALSLWVHKVLRWLSPLQLIGLALGAALIAVAGGPYWPLASLSAAAAAGAVGWHGLLRGRRIPVLATAGTFLLANAAFLVGLTRAWRGRAIKVYQNQ
jgi:cellulose synthase/poly-beta-1,6-N-acetylglucosamine synthase-like glycosyltransferase